MALSKQQFAEQFGGYSLAELKNVVKEGTGKELTASSKDAALAQAYKLYLEGQPVQAESAPPVAPATVPPVMSDPTRPLVFEGRCRGLFTQRHRAGYRFTRLWTVLPDMTEEKRVKIDDDPAVQIRIKE